MINFHLLCSFICGFFRRILKGTSILWESQKLINDFLEVPICRNTVMKRKSSKIVGVLNFCILCSITLFAFSQLFVNEKITPKWLGLMLSVGIAGIVWSMFNCKVFLPTKKIFIILSCFFLFIFVRNWITLDFVI